MIYIVLGTKAQLIKMAPIMRALTDSGINYRFIATGQHCDTMSEILDNFSLKTPDFVLYKGRDITSIMQMIIWGGKILWKTIRNRTTIFGHDKKGIVLVHGDTFSTLLGAMMGRIAGLKVGHVESGLRSFNIFHPFPEELIRLLTFRLSHYFFCPGNWAVQNLKRYSGTVINTGANTLHDSLECALISFPMDNVTVPEQPYAVATIHRFENIYTRPALERIVNILEQIAEMKHTLFILHNPTRNKLREFNLYERLAAIPNIKLCPRYDYFSFIKLISSADFVISDGGSNQEECFYLGKPIMLLRRATERQEGLNANCVLSHYDSHIIQNFVRDYPQYNRPSQRLRVSPSQIIVEACLEYA